MDEEMSKLKHDLFLRLQEERKKQKALEDKVKKEQKKVQELELLQTESQSVEYSNTRRSVTNFHKTLLESKSQ
jgi:hypothetical protein